MQNPIELWHRCLKERDASLLGDLLDDTVSFHSPVVYRPQPGKALTTRYLTAAMAVLDNDSFRYLREIVGERDAALEFSVMVDGIEVNGVDLIRWNGAGRITDFKVMVRPLKGLNMLHRKMAEQLGVTLPE